MTLSSFNTFSPVVRSILRADAQAETAGSTDLLSRAQNGDGDAFCELCRAYEVRLLRQATALSGDAAQAEDLAQETLLEAWKCIRRYNGKCKFFTWLCSIMMNRYKNVRRQSRNRPIALSDLHGSDREGAERMMNNLADCALMPDQMTLVAERAVRLRAGLDRLSAKHRAVIYLRFYVDDSIEGIASALGCSVGTVKSRLFNALERLRGIASHQEFEEDA
ncbi:MAG TPA: sigma-70 family RNA polymerase sigma factor [Verrucomicrobiae bacterium]|nr:sigma-70 family RNA polymerase sigma factor [Verrucomicrobiae bacterium]